MSDPFFETIHDSTWNACVGAQGSEINYVDGYLEAARLLAEAVIEKRLMGSLDTLAMPILYNARHGLELALKYAAAGFGSLGLLARRDGRADHDIRSYWEHLHEADIGDLGTRKALAALEPFLASLSRIDAEGQELRFFERQDGDRSLGDLNVINLTLVRGSVEALSEILHSLIDRVECLSQQHHTGTRTTRCSRDDLVEIARMLGVNATWTEDTFLDRKREVMERFDLTNKAFSNAIDAIRGSRPLAASIGIETPLVHLDDDLLTSFAERWLQAHPPQPREEPVVIRGSEISVEEMEQDAHELAGLVVDTERMLSPEAFADLETIFYIGRDHRFGEEYEANLEETLKEHVVQPRRSFRIYDIVSKVNLIEGLIGGLRRVGRPSLADSLRKVEAGASAA